jgi:hypothetical protein
MTRKFIQPLPIGSSFFLKFCYLHRTQKVLQQLPLPRMETKPWSRPRRTPLLA